MTEQNMRGVVCVHAAPTAVSPHIEWAVGRAIGLPVNFDWRTQPLIPGSVRTEFSWVAPHGAGSLIASSLIGWQNVRFEVTELGDDGASGERWIYTPSLGAFHVHVDEVGNYLVTENRLRSLMEETASDVRSLREQVDRVLGGPWDRELDSFREASDASSVTWLHRVG
ncbi:MAG: DUF3145 family protein [Microbacteriaceae bacterium]